MLYFKEGDNTTETPKKICAVNREGAASDVIKRVKSSLQSFMLDIFPLDDAPVR